MGNELEGSRAPAAGPPQFDLYGRTIRLENGTLRNAKGALAGAHLDMATSLRNLVRKVGLPLADAIAMCSDTPRRALGLTPHALAEGTLRHDVIALDRQFCLIFD